MAQLTVHQLAAKVKSNEDVVELLNANFLADRISDVDLSDLWAEIEFNYSTFLESIDNLRDYIRAYLEDENG